MLVQNALKFVNASLLITYQEFWCVSMMWVFEIKSGRLRATNVELWCGVRMLSFHKNCLYRCKCNVN